MVHNVSLSYVDDRTSITVVMTVMRHDAEMTDTNSDSSDRHAWKQLRTRSHTHTVTNLTLTQNSFDV